MATQMIHDSIQNITSSSTVGGLQIIKASGDYFCAQCLLSCANSTEYKTHYKSELHAYNIKRRMLDLVPATPEQFEMKKKQILDQQKSKIAAEIQKKTAMSYPLAAAVAAANSGSDEQKCVACNKTFASENSFKTHLVSKKHKETFKSWEAKKLSDANSETSSMKSSSTIPRGQIVTTDQDQTICLFCDKKSKDISANMTHMSKQHSFFISEEKYCVDIQGLLKHLGEKINQVYLCILCENKGFKQFTTGEAVKKHMVAKGHCFMQSEIFDEYADYYDFTPQIEAEIEYQKTLKVRANCSEKTIEIVQNKKPEDAEDDGEEWESDIEGASDSDQDEEEDDGAQETKKPLKSIEEENEIPMEKKKPTKKAVQQRVNDEGEWEDESESDEEEQPEVKEPKQIRRKLKDDKPKKYRIHRIKIAKATLNERGELELPNGKTLGHRSLRHIYTQYYRPISNSSSRMRSILGDEGYKQRQIVLASQNFAIQLQKKSKALKLYREEKNLLAPKMHEKAINYLNLGYSHNMLQPHFVHQTPK